MEATPPVQLTILHTNDMHGSLEAMSRLSTFARQQRETLIAAGRQVLLVDAGDAPDRKLRFCSITKGAAFPQILEAMQYDVLTLGNAISITYGPQAAAVMAKRSHLPFLAGNLFKDSQPLMDGLQAVKLFSLNRQVQLGIAGLTVHSPGIYAIFDLPVLDFREAARLWVAALKSEGAQPVILITHLGYQNDQILAQEVPGIDVIIGGHSHTLLPRGDLVNGVLIAQAGDYAAGLGRVDLTIDPQSGVVLEKSAVVIPVPGDTPQDPAVWAAVARAEAEAAQMLDRPIAELSQALELDYEHECGIGNLAADAIRERMGAEIGLLTSGLFHRGLPAGAVRLGDLDAATFSTANPQLSEISGEQLWVALETSLDPEIMKKQLKVFRGAPIGMAMTSGIEVTYDPQTPNGKRIQSIRVAGKALDRQRNYRVAHTDAEVIADNQQDFGYLHLEKNQIIRVEVPTIVREALEDYLSAHSPVPPPKMGRWISI